MLWFFWFLSYNWVVCKSRLYDTTFFLLFSCFFAKLIFSLPPIWVSSLPLIALGFVYIGQGKVLWFVEGSIFFQDFVSSWMFVWEGGINGCGWWLKGLSDPMCQLNISSFWLPHLWQGYHHQCVVTLKYRVMARVKGWLIYVRVWEEDRSRYHIFSIVCCFCTVVNCSFITGTWWFVDLFPCSFFFAFSVSGPFRVHNAQGKAWNIRKKIEKIKRSGKNLQNSWKFVWKSKTSVETQEILFWNKIHFYVKHFLHVHMLLKIYFFSVN